MPSFLRTAIAAWQAHADHPAAAWLCSERRGGVIPPNATLIFDVELLGVK